MPGSVHVIRRKTAEGKNRHIVRYRRGGRGFKIEHAGSFSSGQVANERKNLVAGWLAAGKDPRVELAALAQRADPVTFRTWYGRFVSSRVDVSTSTLNLYRNAGDTLGDLADLDVEQLTAAHFIEWIAANRDLAPATLANYLSKHRQVLDFADVSPNPARSPKVKLPTDEEAEVEPPSEREWRAILSHTSKRLLLCTRLIECCALRVSEAVELTYGDVDFDGGRIRISKRRTKRRTAGQRWLPVPDELLEEIAALVPFDDRHRDREVFPFEHAAVRQGLAAACKTAGVAHYHPHDLRHRRISLWFAHGVDPIQVSRWAGHSRASMSSDKYGHVLVEAGRDEWRAFWLGKRGALRV